MHVCTVYVHIRVLPLGEFMTGNSEAKCQLPTSLYIIRNNQIYPASELLFNWVTFTWRNSLVSYEMVYQRDARWDRLVVYMCGKFFYIFYLIFKRFLSLVNYVHNTRSSDHSLIWMHIQGLFLMFWQFYCQF